MNKQKYLNKIYKHNFLRTSALKKINLVLVSKKITIPCFKIKTKYDFDNYFDGILDFNDFGYLIYPMFNFKSTNNKIGFDIIVLSFNYQVEKIVESKKETLFLDFEGQKKLTLVLPQGMVRFLNINIGDKFKLAKYFE